MFTFYVSSFRMLMLNGLFCIANTVTLGSIHGLFAVYKVLNAVCLIAYFMHACFCMGPDFKVRNLHNNIQPLGNFTFKPFHPGLGAQVNMYSAVFNKTSLLSGKTTSGSQS